MRSQGSEDELLCFMESALRQEGLDDVSVTSYTDHESRLEQIYVQKKLLPNEKLAYKVSIDRIKDTNQIKQKLVSESKYIAEEFRKEISDRYEWEENCVDISLYNEGWAECKICGQKVTAPSATYMRMSMTGELSDPYPVTRDLGRAVEEMTAEQKIAFKLYLLAVLKEECAHTCPNSRYSGIGR